MTSYVRLSGANLAGVRLEGAGMAKTLTKHGNSWALVIERPLLDALNIQPDTPLSVTTDGLRLIVTPADDLVRSRDVDEAHQQLLERYGSVFRRLAE